MLQGVVAFWLSMLPIPVAVKTSVVALCRNFLWRKPKVRWVNICSPKKEGGLGLLDLGVWNCGFMLKHYWHIASRKDCLWVRWVHHRYLSVIDPFEWEPHRCDSPLIKAIIHARDVVDELENRNGSVEDTLEDWCVAGRFRVSKAYEAMREKRPRVSWAKQVWAPNNTPKHMFILWLANLGKLSTFDRLFFLDIESGCRLCGADLETHEHLFFECTYANAIWREVRARFMIHRGVNSLTSGLRWLRRHARGRGCLNRARVFALSASVYYIWHARNTCVFDNVIIPMADVARLVITHVCRLLHELFPYGEVAAL